MGLRNHLGFRVQGVGLRFIGLGCMQQKASSVYTRIKKTLIIGLTVDIREGSNREPESAGITFSRNG